jgi:hypothetical protein
MNHTIHLIESYRWKNTAEWPPMKERSRVAIFGAFFSLPLLCRRILLPLKNWTREMFAGKPHDVGL